MSTAGVAIRSIVSSDYFHNQLDSSVNESIMICVAMSGGMVPMRVLESDSIESVKLRLQTCQGFVMKNQKLVFGGRELARNDSLVRDYGVSDGNVLHLVLRLSDLLVINVKTSCGKEFTVHVDRCRDVGHVKQKIVEKRKGLGKVEEQEVLFDGEKLEDERLINDICKHHDAVVHVLVRKSAKLRATPVEKNYELSIVAPHAKERRHYEFDETYGCRRNSEEAVFVPTKAPKRDFDLEPIIVNHKIELSEAINDVINDTFEGLDSGNSPIRSSEGTGGAYFMQDSTGKKHVAVFKPTDEEPMAVNNPRGLPISEDGEGLKRGTVVGEGALREVAAYILDHPINKRRGSGVDEIGFAGVPPTFLVKCLHKTFNHPKDLMAKIGSLQKFMENYGSCEDSGPGSFPVKEVHKISVLDIRMANADRHAGNILIGKEGKDGQTVLIPIDHGYCLPESFEDCTFDWLYWPQARQPYSAETLNYIKSLDAEEDISILKFYGWNLPSKAARTLRISTMLLKKGAERGLTPFAIGNVMCREIVNKESMIQEIIQEAENSVLPGTSEAAFLETVSTVMDRRLGEISK